MGTLKDVWDVSLFYYIHSGCLPLRLPIKWGNYYTHQLPCVQGNNSYIETNFTMCLLLTTYLKKVLKVCEFLKVDDTICHRRRNIACSFLVFAGMHLWQYRNFSNVCVGRVMHLHSKHMTHQVTNAPTRVNIY